MHALSIKLCSKMPYSPGIQTAIRNLFAQEVDISPRQGAESCVEILSHMLSANNDYVFRQIGVAATSPSITATIQSALRWREAHYLSGGMYTCIRTPGNCNHNPAIGDAAQGLFERRLDAWAIALTLQTAVARPIVLDKQTYYSLVHREIRCSAI